MNTISFIKKSATVILATVIISASVPLTAIAAGQISNLLDAQHKTGKHSVRTFQGPKHTYSDITTHRVTFSDGTTCVITVLERSYSTTNSMDQQCSFPINATPTGSEQK